jgi:hypothetical protein
MSCNKAYFVARGLVAEMSRFALLWMPSNVMGPRSQAQPIETFTVVDFHSIKPTCLLAAFYHMRFKRNA